MKLTISTSDSSVSICCYDTPWRSACRETWTLRQTVTLTANSSDCEPEEGLCFMLHMDTDLCCVLYHPESPTSAHQVKLGRLGYVLWSKLAVLKYYGCNTLIIIRITPLVGAFFLTGTEVFPHIMCKKSCSALQCSSFVCVQNSCILWHSITPAPYWHTMKHPTHLL